jgi:hypothetical protein
MHVDTIENAVLSVTVNPILKYIVKQVDEECPEDGSLLLLKVALLNLQAYFHVKVALKVGYVYG